MGGLRRAPRRGFVCAPPVSPLAPRPILPPPRNLRIILSRLAGGCVVMHGLPVPGRSARPITCTPHLSVRIRLPASSWLAAPPSSSSRMPDPGQNAAAGGAHIRLQGQALLGAAHLRIHFLRSLGVRLLLAACSRAVWSGGAG